MKTPPRIESETAQQRSDRKSREESFGTSIKTLSEEDAYEAPRLVQNVTPSYPDEAIKRGVSGRVSVGVIIDKEGLVSTAKIISSSDPVFEMAALEAVRQWRFTPAKKNGNLIKVSLTVPVVFDLK